MFGYHIKFEKIMNDSYEKERKKEKTGKSIIKRKAGKALAGFFIVILLLTTISSAADSMAVAKVKTTKMESLALKYKTLATGSIVAGSKKYLYLNSGIRVEKILTKKGKKVKPNDEILRINLQDTKKKLKEAKIEYKKLELAYQQKQLETNGNANTSGLDNIGNDVEFAKQDLESAKEKYKEAKSNYDNTVVKQGENALETKTDEYEKAKYEYEQEKLSYDDSVEKANWTLEDAKKKLEDSRETLESLDIYTNRYADSVIAQDYTSRSNILNNIYIIAFGGKEEYEKYKEDLEDAQRQKNIADSSYESSKADWKTSCDKAYATMQQDKAVLDAIKVSDYKTDEEYKTAYNKQLAIYNSSKIEYDRIYNTLNSTTSGASSSASTAAASLSKLKKKTDIIQSILAEYVAAKRSENVTLINAKLEEVEKTVLGESAFKTLMKQIEANEKAYEREKSQYELQMKKLTMTLNNTKKTMDKVKKVLNTVKNGTYDYQTNLESYKQAMNTAKDVVKSCERALVKAKMSNEINVLALESEKIDLDVKKEEIDKLETIIKNKGIVRTEIGGIIEKIDVEEGKVTTSDNPTVTISTGGFSFEVTMSRKEAENLRVKNKCNIKLTGSNDSIDTTIEYIENVSDKTKITVNLPKGDYVVGTNGEFSVEKSSDLFDNCISLNAIRNDNRGNYLLVLGEKESILGKEMVAMRVNVTILDKDSKNAVIESGLSSEDIVINESNKGIKEGDRVRVMK